MNILNKIALGMVLLINACNIHAMDPVTMALIAKSIPPISLNLGINITDQTLKQTCFGEVTTNVYNQSGTVQVVHGSCKQSGNQQMGAMGKYGDMTVIPTTKLNKINLGAVSTSAIQNFQIPAVSNASGWNNATLFTFKPSNPMANSKLPSVMRNPLIGREYQVIIRSLALTRELAQSEGAMVNFDNFKAPILVEAWAQVSPSVTGSKAAKQVLNFVIERAAMNTPMVFAADAQGNASINYQVIDEDNNVVRLVSNSFNVGEEAQ